jgi:hypothetical protein
MIIGNARVKMLYTVLFHLQDFTEKQIYTNGAQISGSLGLGLGQGVMTE